MRIIFCGVWLTGYFPLSVFLLHNRLLSSFISIDSLFLFTFHVCVVVHRRLASLLFPLSFSLSQCFSLSSLFLLRGCLHSFYGLSLNMQTHTYLESTVKEQWCRTLSALRGVALIEPNRERSASFFCRIDAFSSLSFTAAFKERARLWHRKLR